MQKYIKEVFNDYNLENNLIDTKIENINLYKKTNKLQIKVVSSKQISIKEIESFEEYLVNRFKVNKAFIDINYEDGIIINSSIESDWKDIIRYIAKKEPVGKAILNNLDIEKRISSLEAARNFNGGFKEHIKEHPKRSFFFKELDKGQTIEEAVNKSLKTSFLFKSKNKIKNLVKHFISKKNENRNSNPAT